MKLFDKQKNKEIWKRLFPWAWVIMYAALLLWLFHRNVVPFGVWSASIEAPQLETRLIKGPTPEHRVEVDKPEGVYRIKAGPVYFEVLPPRKFDHAEMEVEFRSDVPIVETGVVKSQDPWSVEKRTLYHRYLEELDWPRLQEEGLVLWQRQPKYQSIKEFFADPPPIKEVVTVDASFLRPRIEGKSLGARSLRRFEVSLRGAQDLYLLSYGEDIDVRLWIQDVNRHDGADPVLITLCDFGNCEKSSPGWVEEALDDDGEQWGSGNASILREMRIRLKAPTPGVYRLQVRASDDVVIRTLETLQRSLVWKGQLYIGDEGGYGLPKGALQFWSNGRGFALRTPHPETVQTVQLESSSAVYKVVLEEEGRQYEYQIPRQSAGELLAITSPKRDLIIHTDGLFALSKEMFFLPEPISYTSNLDLDRLGINYVLSRYIPTKALKQWRLGQVYLETYQVAPDAPLQFFVGTPAGQEGSIAIRKMQFRLTRPSLTTRRVIAKLNELISL